MSPRLGPRSTSVPTSVTFDQGSGSRPPRLPPQFGDLWMQCANPMSKPQSTLKLIEIELLTKNRALASSLCIYLSLYLETDNRRKYLLSFWESALADEIRADLITGNVNARWNQNIYLSLGKLVKQLFYTEFKFFKSAHNLRQLWCSDFKASVLFWMWNKKNWIWFWDVQWLVARL